MQSHCFALKIIAGLACLSTATLFAETTVVTVEKGNVRAETTSGTVLLAAGQKTVLAADRKPIAGVDDPMVDDLIRMNDWIQAERTNAQVRIDGASIQINGIESETLFRHASLTEMRNRATGSNATCRIGNISGMAAAKFYDLAGHLLKFDWHKNKENEGPCDVYFPEPVPPHGDFRFIMVSQIVPWKGAIWSEGKIWHVWTANDSPNWLNYFRFILPKSAILLRASRTPFLVDTVDGRVGLTIRNHTGPDADGEVDVTFLWPAKDSGTLADIPPAYRGAGFTANEFRFQTAEAAPADFDAFTFFWRGPTREHSGTRVTWTIVLPDGQERVWKDDVTVKPETSVRSDVAAEQMGPIIGDPRQFRNQNITIAFRSSNGGVQFSGFPDDYRFAFYKAGANGQINWRAPYKFIKARGQSRAQVGGPLKDLGAEHRPNTAAPSDAVAFKTAGNAPAGFHSWTFYYPMPAIDPDASWWFGIVQPDGKYHRVSPPFQGRAGESCRTDSAPEYDGCDPSVFYGKPVVFKFMADKGKIKFPEKAEFAFEFQNRVPAKIEHLPKTFTNSSDEVTFQATAPSGFDGWTLFWEMPTIDADAQLTYVVLQPDGQEYDRHQQPIKGSAGDDHRSDFAPGFAGGDPKVFYGKPILFKFLVNKGTIKFPEHAEFPFEFQKKIAAVRQ